MDKNGSKTPVHRLSPGSKSQDTSPLWDRALEKYREDLDDLDDDDAILETIDSLDDLVAYARTIEYHGSTSSTTLGKLGPKLKFVDEFSTFIVICLGANTKVVACVWGSLRLIISLASSADEALPRALDMLEELSLSFPRFRHYVEPLPVDRAFEGALVDLYEEVVCFYARLIRYYRDNPHASMQDAGWQSLQQDFSNTMRRVKRLSATVEMEADLAKMKVEKDKYDQVLELLKGFGANSQPTERHDQCHIIPISTSERIKGRESDLVAVRKVLNPSETQDRLRSFALYGMGGVGKTQLALKYAVESKKHFDTILWIAADTRLSLEQSFYAAAVSLGLNQEGADGAHELTATARVKNWLCDSTNDRTWLVIFDNADDIDVLAQVWPANGFGSVLVTSRDFSAALSLASDGLNVKPFDDQAGADVLLQLLKIGSPTSEQRQDAMKIVHKLGGLPLALDQIAGFITQRKMRIQDFLPLYERNAAKIDARRQHVTDYPHALSTVFDMALSQLEGSACHLSNLLAFLEPDSVHESLLLDGAELVLDPDFDFLSDEFDLGDVEVVLLRAALIQKDVDEKSLSMHRLIQTAILRRLDNKAQERYFSIATDLLSLGFPDTWSKDVGHQKAQWSRCQRYLPHVNRLVGLATQDQALVEKPDSWAELLLRCSWYLYEREQYEYAESFVRVALNSFTNKETLAYANATDLLGLIDMDMCKPQQALRSFEQGLSIRERLVSPSDAAIAFALNNIAMAYTELPDLELAVKFHKRAIATNKPDAAEEILMQCPSLANCTDETFLQADNPRFVGDMVLLSRIRRAQGRNVDALRLASKALAWRQRVHGDRFKTCDSLYDVASLLAEQGQASVALDLLSQLVAIAETLPQGEGHAARAQFKASALYAEMQRDEESVVHREEAVRLRKKFRPETASVEVDEGSFNALNVFMLW